MNTTPRLNGSRAMRIFGYLGIGFLIVWPFAPIAMAIQKMRLGD
jgi:hypothetical protein